MNTPIYFRALIFVLFYLFCSYTFGQSTKAEYVPGQVLVKLKSGKSVAQKTKLKNQINATPLKVYSRFDIELWELGTSPESVDVEHVVDQYKNHPDIEFIEPNYIYSIGTTVPNDPSFSTLWGMNNIGQNGGTTDADIDAPEAWDIATGSPSVVVAIIDTGIDWGHEDLVDNIWQNITGGTNGRGEDADGDGKVIEWNGSNWVFDPGDQNGLDDDGNGYVDDFVGWDFRNNDNNPYDGHFHGTHCAGTVGARADNGIGVAGVTGNVQLAALKFLSDTGGGSASDAVGAIDYCIAMDIPISNNSWGGNISSSSLEQAIGRAEAAGHLFVAAAGNNNRDTDLSPAFPASYVNANIISVAATDRNDVRASFSNYGDITVDLGAPGVDIYSCVPNDNYGSTQGTSMAAPHVAGACALLWGNNPSRTWVEIKNAILNSVDPNVSLDGNCVSNGRLNLHSAMLAFGGGPPPGTSCRQEDSLSLVALYNSANGASWTTPWNLNQPMTGWEGVTLTQDGCLKVLNLPSSGISGTLPDDIGDLQDATYINMSDNQLTGSIPATVGNLSNLGYLDFSDNQLSGDIPASLGNLQGVAFLFLDGNNLTGTIPPEIANMGGLGFLYLYDNQLSGCLEDELDTLCMQLNTLSNDNASISDGNNFDADWESFCSGSGAGSCNTDVYPGDANADGVVNFDDVLYWGYAKDYTGPSRPGSVLDCMVPQPCPDWTEVVGNPPVNSKHQDCDGNGVVNDDDNFFIEANIGCTTGAGATAFIESTLNFELELVEIDNGTSIYDVSVYDANGGVIDAHGVAFQFELAGIDPQSITVNTSNSSIGAHVSVDGELPGGLGNWVAITRTDGTDVSLNGPICQIIGVVEDATLSDGDDEEVFHNFTNGKVMISQEISTIADFSELFDTETFGASSTNMVLNASINHAGCNVFGTAQVNPEGGLSPYTYQWNTGANTAEITNLTPGEYTVIVTDANNLMDTLTVEVEGLFTEPYDENGDIIPCATLDIDLCPTLITPNGVVNTDTYHANTTVNSEGIILGGANVEFKAGETIILGNDFTVTPNANFSAEIEECPQ